MKQETNIQFITRLMDRAKSGPLMQAFIIEAINQYASDQAAAPAWGENAFLSQDAWKACASECLVELGQKYNRKVPA